MPGEISREARLAIKDEYAFGFLGIDANSDERQLENAVLAKVEPFLQEMGGLFTFVGSQYRLEVSNREYHIDLLLYHRTLRCLVAIELKTGDFMPEYVGKMQFYLAALDDLVKTEDENPSIGIILCKSKDRTIVEYALRKSDGPVGVSVYRMTRALPAQFRGQLPAPEQISRLLDD